MEKNNTAKETPRKAEKKVKDQENSRQKNKNSRKYQKTFIELGKGTSLKGNPDWGSVSRETN